MQAHEFAIFQVSDRIALRAMLLFVMELMSPPHFENAIDDYKNGLAALVEMAKNQTNGVDKDKFAPLTIERAPAARHRPQQTRVRDVLPRPPRLGRQTGNWAHDCRDECDNREVHIDC
jgi:hypothetical protein